MVLQNTCRYVVVVIVGVLCTLSSLGIGRFAFGMILPSMGAGLQLSYSQMGAISTGNFIAYLVGALASGWLTRRFGARATIVASPPPCLSVFRPFSAR